MENFMRLCKLLFILINILVAKDVTYKIHNSTIQDQQNLITIIKQIKQIENLVNEFYDFARIPKPLFSENNIIDIIKSNLLLLNKIDETISIKFNANEINQIVLQCDYEQISRCIFNLIKNSIESIQEKFIKTPDLAKKIDIEIQSKSDYIEIVITDNGTGFSEKNIKNIFKPYFTTKSYGSGLGLSIVNKIINDHNGTIKFITHDQGAKVILNFPNNV